MARKANTGVSVTKKIQKPDDHNYIEVEDEPVKELCIDNKHFQIDWNSVSVVNLLEDYEEDMVKAECDEPVLSADLDNSLFIYRKYGLVKNNKTDWKLFSMPYSDNKEEIDYWKNDIFNNWDNQSSYYEDDLNSKSDKVIGVLYSGGIDSTLCILKALDKGNTVQPIMMRFNDITDEFLTVLNLYILQKHFKGRIKKPIFTIDMSTSFRNNNLNLDGNAPIGYIQQPSAAFALATVNCQNYHISELWAGYIRNDDVLSYKDEWYNLYNNAWKLTHGVLGSNSEPDKVVWPLMKYGKDSVIMATNSLKKKNNLRLVDTSCEQLSHTIFVNPKEHLIKMFIEDCGKCHKCQLNHVYNIADARRVITLKYTNDIPVKSIIDEENKVKAKVKAGKKTVNVKA